MLLLYLITSGSAVNLNPHIKIYLKVIDRDGVITTEEATKIEYLWTNQITTKSACIKDIKKKKDELYEKGNNPDDLPSSLKNNEVIYDSWNHWELAKDLKLEEDDLEICNKYTPFVYCGYVFSTKKWEPFNNSLNVTAHRNSVAVSPMMSAIAAPSSCRRSCRKNCHPSERSWWKSD